MVNYTVQALPVGLQKKLITLTNEDGQTKELSSTIAETQDNNEDDNKEQAINRKSSVVDELMAEYENIQMLQIMMIKWI